MYTFIKVLQAPRWKKLILIGVGLWCGLGVTERVLAQETGENVADLIARCAPTVHPETMSAIISVESRGHQFAIADAGPVRLPWSVRKSMVRSYYMSTVQEAVAKARSLIAAGHTVSLGLSQVNDRNLARFGLSLETIFDPCTNVAAGGLIITNFYRSALNKFGNTEKALRAAISAYNSGDWERGEREGYVTSVFKNAGRPLALRTAAVRVPRIRDVAGTGGNTAQVVASGPAAPIRRTVAPARTTVAARHTREFAMSGNAFPTE